MDPAGVVEKFGVPPERIIDYLALVGDTVDNIPGVEKCGPKTAAKWLDKYGDLDTIMAKADEVGGKIGDNLRAALEQLLPSRISRPSASTWISVWRLMRWSRRRRTRLHCCSGSVT